MEQNYNVNDWTEPCPKYDCRKAACKCGLKYVNIPMSLGDDSAESSVAPKNGAYCNALVFYEANEHVYIYTQEGVPTLIDVDASDISTLEQEVIKAQRDVHELREDIDDFIYGFDTVAQMKAATDLSSGDIVRTLGYHAKGDGGGALYKITNTGTPNEMDVIAVGILSANLIVPALATPEIYGAHCDGVHNDAPYIQSAIDSGHPVLLSKNYLTTSSVYIGNQEPSISGGYKKNLVIDGSKSTVTYTGGNSAFVIAGVEGGNISFGTIEASNGTCIEMWSTNGNVRVDYIYLSFNKLIASAKAIYVHAQKTSTGIGFINEITINGGTIYDGEYGIYIENTHETASNILGMSGYHFYNICFEGCDSNFYFNAVNCAMREFDFYGIRYEENRTAPLMTLVGNVFRGFVFNGMFPIYTERIVYSGATTVNNCVFNAPISGGNEYSSSIIASGMVINANQINYLNNSYNTKTLTKAENIGGTIELDRYMNQVVINFAGITSTAQSATLVIADNMPIKPLKRAFGVVSTNTNKNAYISIDTDGKIMMQRSSGDGSESYYGQITILSYSPKRQN